MAATIGTLDQGYVSTLMDPDLVSQRDILKSVLNVTNEDTSFVDIMELMGRSEVTANSEYHHFINDELYSQLTVTGVPTEDAVAPNNKWTVTVTAGEYAQVVAGEQVLCANGKVGYIRQKLGSNQLEIWSVDGTDLDLADTQKMAVFSNAHGSGSDAPDGRKYPVFKETNHIQIFKSSFTYDDISSGSKVEFQFEGKDRYLFKGQMESLMKFKSDIALALIFGRQSTETFNGTGQFLTDAEGNPVSTTKGLNQYAEEGITIGATGVSTATYATANREFNKQRAPKEYLVLEGTEMRIEHDNMFPLLAANAFSSNAQLNVTGKGEFDFGVDKFTLYGRTFYLKDLPVFDHKVLINFTGSAGFQNRAWYLPMDEIKTIDGGRKPRFMLRYLESAPSPYSVDLRYREFQTGGLAAIPTDGRSICKIIFESRQGLHCLGKQHFAVLDKA